MDTYCQNTIYVILSSLSSFVFANSYSINGEYSLACRDYLYVKLGLLIEDLMIVALVPEMVDAVVVDVVVILVAVLRR